MLNPPSPTAPRVRLDAWLLIPVLLTCLLAALPSRANEIAELRRKADQAFGAEDWHAAADLYAEIADEDPGDAEAVYRMALALHWKGDLEAAAAGHERAAGFEEVRAPALFNLACARSLLGRTEAAWEALGAAFEAGFEDLRAVESDPDLSALRSDPDWKQRVRELREPGEPGSPLTFETLGARMEEEEADGFSGTLLVVRDGEILLHEGYGLANREKDIPATARTLYAIGSTPIDFTKAGILLLAQEGRLDLDDRITEFFSDVPADKEAITLRHLMSGESGLRDFHDLPGDRDPDHAWIDREEALRRIFSFPLLFPPGEGNEHSHSAWGVLAAVIEVVSGRTYPEFTRTRFFEPLGMKDTGFFGQPLPEERLAIGYGERTDGEINAPPWWGPTSWLVMGSGGQVSSVGDLYRWNQALREGRVLGPEWLELYWSPPGTALAGGDQYGFEVFYTEGPGTLFILATNTNVPERMQAFRRLARDLFGLVTASTRPPYTLGVSIEQRDDEVRVAGVNPQSAADQGGLRPGDVLLTAGGKPLYPDPLAVLDPYLRSGDPIELGVRRPDGREETITVRPRRREGS